MGRKIELLLQKLTDGETVTTDRIIQGIIVDSLIELKKLDGEPFIRSAAALVTAIVQNVEFYGTIQNQT